MENELCVYVWWWSLEATNQLINDRTPTFNNLPTRWEHPTLLIKQLDYTHKRTIKWQFIVTFGSDSAPWMMNVKIPLINIYH